MLLYPLSCNIRIVFTFAGPRRYQIRVHRLDPTHSRAATRNRIAKRQKLRLRGRCTLVLPDTDFGIDPVRARVSIDGLGGALTVSEEYRSDSSSRSVSVSAIRWRAGAAGSQQWTACPQAQRSARSAVVGPKGGPPGVTPAAFTRREPAERLSPAALPRHRSEAQPVSACPRGRHE